MADHEHVIRRIKKCLALSESNNPHEAATALRQAQALMRKHGIDQVTLSASEVNTNTSGVVAGKKVPKHIGQLANVVASAFGAEPILISVRRGRWEGRVQFIGAGGAAEVAGYAFEVLSRQLAQDRKRYMAAHCLPWEARSAKTKRGDLYARGWVCAVSEQVIPHVRSENEEGAIAAYKEKRYQGQLQNARAIDRSHNLTRDDAHAAVMGYEDGAEVQFRHGVTGTDRAALPGQ